MLNRLKLYFKVIKKILKHEVIDQNDYKEAYNDVSSTYKYWIERMGEHTDKIINVNYLAKDCLEDSHKVTHILDFACGTGYISRRILELGIPFQITAVDISDKMLEQCSDLASEGVKLINMDGMEYLHTTNDKYDIVLCGWALPYFQHKALLDCFSAVLKDDGIVGVIANSKGTLNKMEKIFLNVMERKLELLNKPMNIAYNLPKDKGMLIKWFERSGFKGLDVGDGEATFTFDAAETLFEWLNITGALAGTAHIFKDYESVKLDVIEEIKRQKIKDNQYEINHKFVYGIFKKGGINHG